MSKIAIKVENLSKMYRLGDIGSGSLGTDIASWWAQLRGQENPYSKIAIANDRSQKSTSDFVWSLKNIDFEIQKGDAVGIIGKNGAGKSTLLKILSRTTSPTTGSIKIQGRVASLLEVGTGFHGDLSGKENIYMNGAILGMTKREIKSKLEEIIDFSGVAGYIDTPVKRYSSGMYVRLAFAVAAHLDPEIMIVDEVLAVGDAEFQKKCLGKMQDVNNKEGRTVIFVSHHLKSISQLCTKGIFLKFGEIQNMGNINEVTSAYLNDGSQASSYVALDDKSKPIQILEAKILNNSEYPISEVSHKDDFNIRFTIKNFSNKKGLRCNLCLLDNLEALIFVDRVQIKENCGYQTFNAKVPGGRIISNKYKITLSVDIPSVELIEMMPSSLNIDIVDLGAEISKFGDIENGIIIPQIIWN